MGKRERYEPGAFCWADVAASDVDAAKAFYGELFAWEFEDRPAGDGPIYSIARRDGAVVGGLMALPDEGPPRWQSYIAVASADAAAEKAEAAGAEIVAGPMDVGPPGRFAAFRDPTGAVVCVWEPGERVGAEIANQPGALCWNDLMTGDVEGAVDFYTGVFGWQTTSVPEAPDGRHSIHAGESLNGGIAAIPEGSPMPTNWLACFAVEDVPASLATAEGAGAQSPTGILELPNGKFAVVVDPQGAAFGIIDGEMDD